MLRPSVLLAVLLGATSMATAADLAEVMGSRYMRYQFCMEKNFAKLGQPVFEKLGIATVVNRWGVSEPTAESLALQPPSVLKVDAECRKANDLTHEPKPRV